MLPFFREYLMPPSMPTMSIPEDEELTEDDMPRRPSSSLELSRSLSMRVLNHIVRRPYGSPRQVGSLVAIDRGILDRGFFRAASAGTLLFLGRGRARSLPTLSIFPSPGMSYELLMAAFRGRRTLNNFEYTIKCVQ